MRCGRKNARGAACGKFRSLHVAIGPAKIAAKSTGFQELRKNQWYNDFLCTYDVWCSTRGVETGGRCCTAVFGVYILSVCIWGNLCHNIENIPYFVHMRHTRIDYSFHDSTQYNINQTLYDSRNTMSSFSNRLANFLSIIQMQLHVLKWCIRHTINVIICFFLLMGEWLYFQCNIFRLFDKYIKSSEHPAGRTFYRTLCRTRCRM